MSGLALGRIPHHLKDGRGEGAIMNLLMAASVVALAPIVVVFFFAQRYFIAGITLTGLKEG